MGILAVVIVFLMVSGWSYVGALTASGQASFGVRTVEWIRGHGGGGIVREIENVYYSINAPKKGGLPPSGALKPPVASKGRGANSSSTTVAVDPSFLPAPQPVKPIASPALPGEGKWTPEGAAVAGHYGLYVTLMRPDAVHTSLVAGLAWMDPHLLSFIQFAGAQQPPTGGPWPYMAPIPQNLAPNLVAAFNSGFRMQDAHGGYYAYGKMAMPLVDGDASFVVYSNGTAGVVDWSSGQKIPSNVSVVRQNLHLILNNGKVNPEVYSQNYQAWGQTVGNAVLVWRSGIGVTANGALVYAAGPGLSVASLSQLLQRAGAVRAMELDINSTWVNYFYFNQNPGAPATPSVGTRLVYNMLRPPQRYFEGTARDFVAAFARSAPLSYNLP